MKRTLKGIRTDLQLDQKQMADKLDMTIESYKNLEQGRTKMLGKTFVKILDLAGINDYHELELK